MAAKKGVEPFGRQWFWMNLMDKKIAINLLTKSSKLSKQMFFWSNSKPHFNFNYLVYA